MVLEAEADSATVVAAQQMGSSTSWWLSKQVKLRETEQAPRLDLAYYGVYYAGQTTSDTHISSDGSIRSSRNCGECKRACCYPTLGNRYRARVFSVQNAVFYCNLRQCADRMAILPQVQKPNDSQEVWAEGEILENCHKQF